MKSEANMKKTERLYRYPERRTADREQKRPRMDFRLTAPKGSQAGDRYLLPDSTKLMKTTAPAS